MSTEIGLCFFFAYHSYTYVICITYNVSRVRLKKVKEKKQPVQTANLVARNKDRIRIMCHQGDGKKRDARTTP